MKKAVKNIFLLAALIAGFGLLPVGQVTAQTFTSLYSFSGTGGFGGTNPISGLIISGNTLFGTEGYGDTPRNGSVFKIATDGTDFTKLYRFTALSFGSFGTNSDGANPYSGLVLSGNILYGTARGGGSSSNGTVFSVNIDGTGFKTLHRFTTRSGALSTNTDGATPYGGLILSGNTLYGTTHVGGNFGKGTVFAISTNGTTFTTLRSFGGSDGANPFAGLILSGDVLYGSTILGGNFGEGTVFAIKTNGTSFTTLYNFAGADGFGPHGRLVLSGNVLYGTTRYGGNSDKGTVFKINISGSGFANLYSFAATTGSYPNAINDTGALPFASLALSGNTLYGTAYSGGSSGGGTLFAINTNGANFMVLHTFTARSGTLYTNSDGATPYGEMFLSGNTFYGTTARGGSSGSGTVFSLALPQPQLTIIPSATNIILTWSTNFDGFNLQSITNLSSAVWDIVSPSPTVINGQNVVTNSISGTQKFFRLSQ